MFVASILIPLQIRLAKKIDGLNQREKFRIRYYNGDISNIQLEKKSKKNGLSLKKCENN